MCYPGTIVDKGITGLQNQESTSSIVIKSREEFFFHLSRLSTSGKLEEAAHTTASWMYPFLVPYYDDWKYRWPLNSEELLCQIVEQPLVKRYMTPWERVLTIVSKHPEAVGWWD